jgi:hypothetical protein
MSNKEIVSKGLQARKDVRAAETRAEKFRQDAADQRDARFYERNKQEIERRGWQDERAQLHGCLVSQQREIFRLTKDLEIMRNREQHAQQLHTIAGVVKAILIAMMTVAARDMGWVVTWLATVLLIVSVAYMIHAVVTLTRKK